MLHVVVEVVFGDVGAMDVVVTVGPCQQCASVFVVTYSVVCGWKPDLAVWPRNLLAAGWYWWLPDLAVWPRNLPSAGGKG